MTPKSVTVLDAIKTLQSNIARRRAMIATYEETIYEWKRDNEMDQEEIFQMDSGNA